jgi:hypothetical protein
MDGNNDGVPVHSIIDDVLASPEFNWKNAPTDQPGLLERFWQVLKDWISRALESISPDYAEYANWLLILIFASAVLIVLGFVVYYFYNKRPRTRQKIEAQEPEKLLAPSVYQAQLEDAIRVQDWLNALRLSYLLVLSTLEQCRWVHSDRTLTNYQYLQEFQSRSQNPEMRRRMERLTIDFEKAFYGTRHVPPTEFKSYHAQAQEFLSQLTPFTT